MGGYYYETQEGDTWDIIAYKVYGDEYCVGYLMEDPQNWDYLEIYMFPAGIKIWAPEKEETAEEAELPSWREDDDDSEYTDDDSDEDEDDDEEDDE